jgi:hypothetical protein
MLGSIGATPGKQGAVAGRAVPFRWVVDANPVEGAAAAAAAAPAASVAPGTDTKAPLPVSPASAALGSAAGAKGAPARPSSGSGAASFIVALPRAPATATAAARAAEKLLGTASKPVPLVSEHAGLLDQTRTSFAFRELEHLTQEARACAHVTIVPCRAGAVS